VRGITPAALAALLVFARRRARMIDSEDAARRFCADAPIGRAWRGSSASPRCWRGERAPEPRLVAVAATVWQRHFADSLQLLDHVPRETAPWLDLGSGAGIPASCCRARDRISR
jgi:16S rRNA (guanine527-N7)-methyltransferase